MMKQTRIIAPILALFLVIGMLLPLAEAAAPDPDVDPLCRYVLLEDMDSDTVLYGRDSDEKIYPASTTKLITALVVLRHVEAGDLSLDTMVKCSRHVQDGMTGPAARAMLQPGEEISVRDLLYLLMLPSHCDAGNALAEAVSGSVKKFAKEMNRTAQELGCTGSHFTNPHGLHNDDHYTTCQDMYRLAKAAYQYKDYRTIVSTTEYSVPGTNKHPEPRNIHNTNALISNHTYGKKYLYKYCTGGKTGSTFQAQYCLVSYAEKKGRSLCCVMMHSEWYYDRDQSKLWMQFVESKRLYQWAFDTFREKTLVEKGVPWSEAPVTDAMEGDTLPLTTGGSLTALVDKDLDPEDLTYTVQLTGELTAPIHQGDPVGTLLVSHGEELLGSVPLTAAEDRTPLPKILDHLGLISHEPRSRSPLVPLLFLAGGVGILAVVLLKRKNH